MCNFGGQIEECFYCLQVVLSRFCCRRPAKRVIFRFFIRTTSICAEDLHIILVSSHFQDFPSPNRESSLILMSSIGVHLFSLIRQCSANSSWYEESTYSAKADNLEMVKEISFKSDE